MSVGTTSGRQSDNRNDAKPHSTRMEGKIGPRTNGGSDHYPTSQGRKKPERPRETEANLTHERVVQSLRQSTSGKNNDKADGD